MEFKTPRQLQAEKTRSKIIFAMFDLLENKPLQDITIRQIAQAAGVSTGTFYVYFPSKEAAVLYVYRSLDNTFTELELSRTPRENLLRLLESYLALAEADTLPLLRKLYIAHLSHYDEYFFSEQRPLFQLIQHQLTQLCPGKNAAHLTWKLLDYCRGSLYNLCIKPPPEDLAAWRAETIGDLLRLIGL